MRRPSFIKPRIGRESAGALAVLALLLPGPVMAQEAPRWSYSAPIGLTEIDTLRVTVAPAPGRIHNPRGHCDGLATIEILDAIDLTPLATFPTRSIAPGDTLQIDFIATAGDPPVRQEVIVRTSIERTPARRFERGTLSEICPLTASWQVFDQTAGRPTVAGEFGFTIQASDSAGG